MTQQLLKIADTNGQTAEEMLTIPGHEQMRVKITMRDAQLVQPVENATQSQGCEFEPHVGHEASLKYKSHAVRHHSTATRMCVVKHNGN